MLLRWKSVRLTVFANSSPSSPRVCLVNDTCDSVWVCEGRGECVCERVGGSVYVRGWGECVCERMEGSVYVRGWGGVCM